MATPVPQRTIYADPDKEIVVTSREKQKKAATPLFTAVGREYIRYGEPSGYPFIETLLSFSKGEQWAFGIINRELDYTNNIAHIKSQSLSLSERSKFSKAFTLLKSKGLVKRIQKEMYIVNPEAIFHHQHYEDVKNKWDSIP